MLTGDREGWLIPSFILLLFLLCASLWSLVVPPFETPDEPGHARFVDFLLERGRLPRAGEEAPGEAHQPPLYYALAAVAARAAGPGAIEVAPERNPAFRWYGGTEENKYRHPAAESPPLSGSARALHRLRLLSVILAAGTVALVYRMATTCLGSAPAAGAAAALAAFIPQYTFIAGSLNNDNLANLLSAGALACLASALARPGRVAPWAGAGLLTGLGLLCKFTGLALLPCGLLAMAWTRSDRHPSLRAKAAAFLAPALALPAPLLLRNLIVLGDPLGAAAQVETLPQLVDRKAILSAYFVTEFPAVLFRSFWGTFGWMSFEMPGWFHAVCLLASILSLAGLALMRRGERALRLHLLFGAAIAAQLAQVAIYNLTFTQAQGRFLFPAIGPIAILMTSGLAELGRRAGIRAFGAGRCLLLAAALAAVNLAILALVVAPAYLASRAYQGG